MSPSVGSVLIIESDPSVRAMMVHVLQRAGFETCTGDGDGSHKEFDVIVRDLNLAPAAQAEARRELTSMPPHILQRTVIATTEPDALAKRLGAAAAFAVIRKPFDIEEFIRVVTACARGPRHHSHRSRPALHDADADGGDGARPIRVEALRKFVKDAPNMRQLLMSPVVSPDELLLRAEMRQMIRALSAALTEAAEAEPSDTRAAVYASVARMAQDLAGMGARWTAAEH